MLCQMVLSCGSSKQSHVYYFTICPDATQLDTVIWVVTCGFSRLLIPISSPFSLIHFLIAFVPPYLHQSRVASQVKRPGFFLCLSFIQSSSYDERPSVQGSSLCHPETSLPIKTAYESSSSTECPAVTTKVVVKIILSLLLELFSKATTISIHHISQRADWMFPN